MKTSTLVALVVLGSPIVAFADTATDAAADAVADTAAEEQAAPVAASTPAGPFAISSDAFRPGQAIPPDYTCDGPDRSPPVHWSGAPAEAKAFALVVDDPDAPNGTFVHWVIYNVPGAARALDKGVAPNSQLGDGSRQAKNDFGKVGWNGPCPPKGASHRYRFKLYALSEPLDVQPGSGHRSVTEAVKGKVVGSAELAGTYKH